MDDNKFKELLFKVKYWETECKFIENMSWREFYDTCDRGDWFLWLFPRINPTSIREFTLAKAHCANLERKWMYASCAFNAIDVAIRFGEGKAEIVELTAAADYARHRANIDAEDAYDAINDDGYPDTAANAYASGSAAAIAAATVDADAIHASETAYDFSRSYSDINAAAYEKAWIEYLCQSADICRQYLPFEIWNCSRKG